MPIGYYNFGNIEQGNQFAANQLAGLGQQIGQAITTHAQTQSAKAMLPMLQSQYAQGIQKIANGDPNGMSDVYGAAVTASQNPLLAPFAQHAVSTAQSANINAQHMARTQAYLYGKNLGLAAKYPGFIDPNTGAVNPNYQSPAKQMTPYQQAEVDKANRQAQVNQINSYNSLYSGTDKSEGIGSLAQKIQNAVAGGSAPDPADVRSFASKVSAYKQAQSAYGNQAVPSPEIEAAYQQVQGQIPALNSLIQKEQAKGTGITGTMFGLNTNPKTVAEMQAGVQQLKGLGGLPAARAGQSSGIDHVGLYQQAQQAIKNGKDPNAVFQKLKDLGFDPNAYRQQIQQQQGATQGGPQTSIDTSGGQEFAQSGPEAQDETEAVSGGSEETPSEEETTMVA